MNTFLRLTSRLHAIQLPLWVVGWVSITVGPVLAQPVLPAPTLSTQAPAAVAEPLLLRGFTVIGDNPLDDAATTRTVAPFLRAEVSMDLLQKATAAFEAALVAKGYTLHRVVLPAQEVSDNLTLQVVRFAIGRVVVEGAGFFGDDNIRRSLPELQEGETPSVRKIAVQTALGNENPAKRVQVALRGSDDNPDRIDATVRVQTSNPFTGAASWANTGNASSGRDRFSLTLGHANLWGRDHQFYAALTTSLATFADVRQLGLSYRLPFYAVGGMLDLSLTDSTVLGQFGTFTSTGAGNTLSVLFTQHYGGEGGLTRYATVGLEDKVFDATSVTSVGGVSLPVHPERRSRPLSLGLKARQQSDTAYWDAHLTLATNLPGGRGNTLTAYQDENQSITRTRWSALRWGGSRVGQMPGGWLMGVRLQGQWASTSLIAGEQFGLGGAGSLRGMGERVMAADSGLGSGLEFTTPILADGLRGVVFADAGWLRRRSEGAVRGAPRSDSALSVGFGMRYGSGPLAVSLDYARVVKGSRTPLSLNASAPQKGEDKLHLTLSAQF
ncbi:MAG: ShlB/FhaC/HecB family hemolysin secretion/activation protein [Hydrogenophaga sp.]|uniref:ShlB/FhaC/HecB family hemolysin secretion/activation protein n=1 Tax=Hydrogenophaga sp. TaxID=1904254 RepID=UPI0027741101|nr:ShlB/FhaC/HecB family hemolysin secretion/activation protein [Hydrogenophaga sp.]MDP2416962.1 ShlB/FhaC/HecB family hemolysin secretion/activation protein [Hydrogenophaga sp.]MDZ4188458.1 ShlB/FhaC/HecB family hemolysin secretion/activation protein [Hydrogenophaga sp.]